MDGGLIALAALSLKALVVSVSAVIYQVRSNTELKLKVDTLERERASKDIYDTQLRQSMAELAKAVAVLQEQMSNALMLLKELRDERAGRREQS